MVLRLLTSTDNGNESENDIALFLLHPRGEVSDLNEQCLRMFRVQRSRTMQAARHRLRLPPLLRPLTMRDAFFRVEKRSPPLRVFWDAPSI